MEGSLKPSRYNKDSCHSSIIISEQIWSKVSCSVDTTGIDRRTNSCGTHMEHFREPCNWQGSFTSDGRGMVIDKTGSRRDWGVVFDNHEAPSVFH